MADRGLDELDPELLEFFDELAQLGIIESDDDHNHPDGPDYSLSEYSYRVADALNRMIALTKSRQSSTH